MPKPSSSLDECTKTIQDSKPKVEENGRKAVFLNPKREQVKIVHVDGCLIKGSARRADYIVSKPKIVDVIVELKGKGIYHARDQIMATLPLWRSQPPFSSQIAALIVCSKSPASASELQVMKAKARKHGIVLIVEESGRREYDFGTFN
jgi:hypothetical protein